ncbi:probable pinoresinol-lariciresinol reductase 3 isoform X2 [Olea europaea var. sylvestris]|uniref:NmrA-like domain-containing protein n=1 Tax=Olea europaea subsp. europaea TaxID=158383 RepID=A0A8S0R3R5_OLEEU|nr:probable pinoresinol-lariciresinol reductase 3 isoform X2 [Olea europaea var. sylvestris]CAA2974029.1 Hypothetical predicted protein [Olea europaea subsp. europaea]
MASSKSKILIIGITGNLGLEIAKASINASHPTFGLVRASAFSDPNKLHKIQFLLDSGVTLLKRFFPSEFGADPDRTQVSDIDNNFYARKAEIRRLIEAEGIPHTYICCNFFMTVLLPSLVQPGRITPPTDKAIVFGDGNVKGVFVKQSDVAAFTISAVDDPRTLNRTIYLRPPGNVLSVNELIEIWERKIGKNLERIYVTEEELLKKIQERPYPYNWELLFIYSAFVKGDHTYFDIDSSLEGSRLYPHIKYTTVSEYLDTLL